MSILTPVLIAALCFIPPTAAAASGWNLSLEAPQDEIFTNGPFLLRVTLENAGPSPQVAFKGFWPSMVEDSPATVLRFEVTRDGKPVEFLGELPAGDYGAAPHWSQFEEIPAGWFFGTTVDLQADPWRFEPLKPGTYQIRAQVVFHARAWFRKHYVAEPGEETIRKLYPQRELLADGEVVSNEITVRVRSRDDTSSRFARGNVTSDSETLRP